MADVKDKIKFLNSEIAKGLKSTLHELRTVMGELVGYRVKLYLVNNKANLTKEGAYETYDISASMIPKHGELPEKFSFRFLEAQGFDSTILEGRDVITVTERVDEETGEKYFTDPDGENVVELGRMEDVIYVLQYLMSQRAVINLNQDGDWIKAKN